MLYTSPHPEIPNQMHPIFWTFPQGKKSAKKIVGSGLTPPQFLLFPEIHQFWRVRTSLKYKILLILKLFLRQHAVHDVLYNLHFGRPSFHLHHHRASKVNIQNEMWSLEKYVDSGILRCVITLSKWIVGESCLN